MKKAKLLLLFFSCCLLTALSGCDINVNPYNLTADEITGIWVETLPALPDSPKYTDDPEMINDIVEYINGLKLRLRTARDEDLAGMATRIEITYADGTVREFWHSGNVYFKETDGVIQYVMEYEQAAAFEDAVYKKMQNAPLNNETNITSNPYFVLFSHLFSDSPGLRSNIQNIAVDLAALQQLAVRAGSGHRAAVQRYYAVGALRAGYALRDY